MAMALLLVLTAGCLFLFYIYIQAIHACIDCLITCFSDYLNQLTPESTDYRDTIGKLKGKHWQKHSVNCFICFMKVCDIQVLSGNLFFVFPFSWLSTFMFQCR